MKTAGAASGCLTQCEGSLRDLAAKALGEADYSAVRYLTEIAEAVSLLKRRIPTTDRPQFQECPLTNGSSSGGSSPTGGNSAGRKVGTKVKGARAYPKFFRQGERLVKVGWSKKAREEYEHRTPRQAVVAFAWHLTSRVQPGRVFAMDGLLPVPDPATGDEIPAYQAYVTLAWLREAKAIEKKGRDGYVLRVDSLADGGLDQLWDHLPERSA